MIFFVVFFDMDGLFVDFEWIIMNMWIDVLNVYGVVLIEIDYLQIVGCLFVEGQVILVWLIGDFVMFDVVCICVCEQFVVFELYLKFLLKFGVFVLFDVFVQVGILCVVVLLFVGDVICVWFGVVGVLLFFCVIVGGDEVVCGKFDLVVYWFVVECFGVLVYVCVVFEDSDFGVQLVVGVGVVVVIVFDLKVLMFEIVVLSLYVFVLFDDVIVFVLLWFGLQGMLQFVQVVYCVM